jgi:hypothetical protein
MERETGIEPATFSLGKWLKIENKEHSEFRHLFPAIEFRENSRYLVARLLMEFKRSSLGTMQEFDPSWRNGPLRCILGSKIQNTWLRGANLLGPLFLHGRGIGQNSKF